MPRWNRWELVCIPASLILACGAGKIQTLVNDQAEQFFPDQVHRYRETALDQGDFPMLATSMLISGPAEEIILVPALILLLRQGGARPWVAVMIAVGLTPFCRSSRYESRPVARGRGQGDWSDHDEQQEASHPGAGRP